MRFISVLAGMACCAVISLGSSAAHAVVYTLTTTDVPSFGAGPYGTITVTLDADGKSLDIVETLNAGFRFHANPDPNHHALTFSLAGDPGVTISRLGTLAENPNFANFSLVSTSKGSVKEAPFGTFDYGIDCTGCGPGYAGGNAGPLAFVLTPSTGALTLASLEFNTYYGKKIYFGSDLVVNAQTGNTGNAGATYTPAVPEPSTWAMVILGFAGMGLALHRRKSRPVRLAA